MKLFPSQAGDGSSWEAVFQHSHGDTLLVLSGFYFSLGWPVLCILACDSVSSPSLSQFISTSPVVLCFDKPKVLATGVSALEGRGGGSGPTAQAVHGEILKSPGQAVQHLSLVWPPESSSEVQRLCCICNEGIIPA